MKDTGSSRAQMHTLEGITAAVIVVMAAFVMVQSLAITPTSDSTASKAVESEMQQLGNDVLAQAQANGDLKEAVLDWDDQANRWRGAGLTNFRGEPPDNDFGDSLSYLFDDRNIAYNLRVTHPRPNQTDTSTRTVVDNGDPTDNTVVASQKVVLRHEDNLTDDTPLTNASDYSDTSTYPIRGYTQDSGEYRPGVYNVVEVRLIIWRK